MGNIVTVEANAILAASVAGTAYPAVTKPVTLALITSATPSTNVAIGSEVVNASGSTYLRQDTTTGAFWGTASGGSITNSAGAASFTGMPACTIAGIELWDTAVTPRTVADGATTNLSATITSATANFQAGDVGAHVTGSGIPTNTFVLSVTNTTTAVLTANATATASGVSLTITDNTPVRRWFGTLTAQKTVNAGDTVTFATSSISITLS